MSKLWLIWIVVSALILSYFSYTLLAGEDKTQFLIGESTYGHYQIEMACETCHTTAFGGQEVLQDACVKCHAEELEQAHDSHPKSKFTDPREAYRLKTLDARYCISCHTEHQHEQTRDMGVTLPDDYCYHCHQETLEKRESHKDLAFDSCATSGCHNYHDNRALYEDFLVDNANQPWLKLIARIDLADKAKHAEFNRVASHADELTDKHAEYPEAHADWLGSSHATADVQCADCHMQQEQTVWIDKPNVEQCKTCHSSEAQGFLSGKHGMRLSKNVEHPNLTAISGAESKRLDFKPTRSEQPHGCNSCHSAHSFDRQTASVNACLSCHNDNHTMAFNDSPHGKLWLQAQAGEIDAEAAVSCATCHMPRYEETVNDEKRLSVQHNQNDNLRPNEKMIRPVCMQCHSLEFSIDALADDVLIENNFNGKPNQHIPSIDWAVDRVKK